MITEHQFLAFGLAALILIAIPGPSVVFVIGRALAYGRGVALATVIGNSAGLLCIVVLVAFGLGAIVQESIVVFTVLKFAGAAYLVWLGVQAIRHRKAFSVAEPRGGRAGDGLAQGRYGRGSSSGSPTRRRSSSSAPCCRSSSTAIAGHVPMQMLLLGLSRWRSACSPTACGRIIASQLRTWFNASPKTRRGDGRRRRHLDDRPGRRVSPSPATAADLATGADPRLPV